MTSAEIRQRVDGWLEEANAFPPARAATLLRRKAEYLNSLLAKGAHDAFAMADARDQLMAHSARLLDAHG